MGATARNHISQLPRPTTEGDLIPAVFLDPASRVCVVEPDEISDLSRLAPLIVFVPRTARIQGNHSGGRSAGLARVDKESTAQLLQTFFTGSEQIDRPNRESEVGLRRGDGEFSGDARISGQQANPDDEHGVQDAEISHPECPPSDLAR